MSEFNKLLQRLRAKVSYRPNETLIEFAGCSGTEMQRLLDSIPKGFEVNEGAIYIKAEKDLIQLSVWHPKEDC